MDTATGASIRVLVADDHRMVRNGLKTLLDGFDDLEFIGEAVDGEEAIQLSRELEPDIILMDILMPGKGGIAAIREICEAQPAVRIIVLSNVRDRVTARAALEAGAVGYLQKDVSVDELVRTIRMAANAS